MVTQAALFTATPADKIAALKAKQAKLSEQIAKQIKLEQEREKRAAQQKLLEAGKAVAFAGLIELSTEDLKAILARVAAERGIATIDAGRGGGGRLCITAPSL